ncbi:maltose alpha-D-glucosyltransferase [Caldilinea sp.]|jgi:trehalose synthase|uniref:maltose alpha-D-glucosyltransferase n=1 Tax=Caldilinea sp. TaxID=2293560 RepID=UPI00261116E9|nr:maltose alpha-D-glucosyltransferase [uncultured Caldilinea sp.]
MNDPAHATHPSQPPGDDEIRWLLEHAMLEQSAAIRRRYIANGALWRRPYANAQPRAAAAMASVWFAAYPNAIITRPGESVLRTLGDPALWRTFAEIGIQAVHTGPMKRAGGVSARTFTPSIDGNFDRIGLEIDPALGTTAEFIAMCQTAKAHGAIVIDDIVPGHTGKGPDFRLAERAYGEYPGIYHMVEIAPEDWPLLPPVPEGRDSVNLPHASVLALRDKGYIVGPLPRTIFYEPGVKETDWSATDVVVGVDGVARRWVYLHYFKEGQPTLNWLDPSFAAQRLVLGDALHSLGVLGASMLRLDANGFLGIERRVDGSVWSEGHPLSVTANQLIAGLVRKMGGFTFQELNLTVDDIAIMSRGGADLSYDFITRPAYHVALVTGDAEFLRLMLREMHSAGVDPASLVHALQNHDELTLELVHFWTLHKDDRYAFGGRELSGGELREQIRALMYERLAGPETPYNLRFTTNGVACTMASLAAAALRLRDLEHLDDEQVAAIQRAHLLMAMYNALQPGVFALSGWDLVGALTLPAEAVADRMADGDTRWINRGAYDLMDVNPTATHSEAGLPRARALYGSLPEQLRTPGSFVSELRRLLDVRRRYRLYASRQIAVPDAQSPGLLILVHELPDNLGVEVTALNFSLEPVEEMITLPGLSNLPVRELLQDEDAGRIDEHGRFWVRLQGHEGKAYLTEQR